MNTSFVDANFLTSTSARSRDLLLSAPFSFIAMQLVKRLTGGFFGVFAFSTRAFLALSAFLACTALLAFLAFMTLLACLACLAFCLCFAGCPA